MNILFLMCDQLRADHVSWHEYSQCETPHLMRLADRGTVFERCTSVSPVCTPARCALLTGKYPHQLSMLRMSGDLSPQHPTYARALQEAGYYTAGIGKFHWLQTWNWSRARGAGLDLAGMHAEFKAFGFDEVWEATGKQLVVKNHCDWAVSLEEHGILEEVRDFVQAEGANTNDAEKVTFTGDAWPFPDELYSDVLTTDKALEVLRGRPEDQPFMLFASLCSPHAPFDPPEKYLTPEPYTEEDDFTGEGAEMDFETKQRMYKLRRAYKAMVRLVDDQIGRVLDELEAQNLMENTLIVFTSDHGEMLGDHARFQKDIWYKESATVPLVIRDPRDLQPRRNASSVELTDVTATLLDAAGLDPKQALSKSWPAHHNCVPCKSLLPLTRGEAEQIRDFSFSENRDWTMIETPAWKYIRTRGGPDPLRPRETLIDLIQDPEETRDLSKDPAWQSVLNEGRLRLSWVLDETPAAQLTWASLMPEQK